jgi:hypothetical protein
MTPLDDIEHGIRVLAQAIVGALFMAGGGLLLWFEFHTPPTHSTHVYLGVALAVFGAAILPSIGPAVMKALSAIVDALVKLLPFRTPQPPAPPAGP